MKKYIKPAICIIGIDAAMDLLAASPDTSLDNKHVITDESQVEAKKNFIELRDVWDE